jgi:hypothetical protein
LWLWIPVALLLVFVLGPLILPLVKGNAGSTEVIGITSFVLLIVCVISLQKWRLARALQSPDPSALLHSIGSTGRMRHGSLLSAALSANYLAAYGRLQEAEQALDSVSWKDAPPFIEAQRSSARSLVAYLRNEPHEGLVHAESAVEEADVDTVVPGANLSALAIRTYRNLGLALSRNADDAVEQELRTAHARLPLLGSIIAAWGLAVIAKHKGEHDRSQTLRKFIADRAPHFAPVLQSIDAA